MLKLCLCGFALNKILKTRLGLTLLVAPRGFLLSVVLLCVVTNTNADSSSDQNTPLTGMPHIIVNNDVNQDSLSLKKLRAIFAMKSRFWSEGQPVSVFVLAKESPLHGAFCKKILNIFPTQLESIWYRQVYTGTGQAPIEVSSEAELRERVSTTPGAIGYIKNNNEKIKRINDDFKIITIE